MDARPARAPVPARRYPLLGGAAAWYLPLLGAAIAGAAAAVGALDVALGAAAFGWAVRRLTCSVAVEIAPIGLTRGILGLGSFRARTTVIAWDTVAEVHTQWSRPGDDLALETVVRDREGRTIRLSTAMGLAAYWACLGEIVRRAPAARRSGITDAVMVEAPPSRRHLVSAMGTAAGLALALAALVSVHYLWAQGRSSLSRDLERIGAVTEPAPACPAVARRSVAGGGEGRAAAGDRCP
jgi:hypothetical protein